MLSRLRDWLHELSSQPAAQRQYSQIYVPFIHAVLDDDELMADRYAWASVDMRWNTLVNEYRAFYAQSASLAQYLRPGYVQQHQFRAQRFERPRWPYLHAARYGQEPRNPMTQSWPLESEGLGVTQEGFLSQSPQLFARLQEMIGDWERQPAAPAPAPVAGPVPALAAAAATTEPSLTSPRGVEGACHGQEDNVEVLVLPENISNLVEYGDMASPTPRDYRHARRHALQNQGAQDLRARRVAFDAFQNAAAEAPALAFIDLCQWSSTPRGEREEAGAGVAAGAAETEVHAEAGLAEAEDNGTLSQPRPWTTPVASAARGIRDALMGRRTTLMAQLATLSRNFSNSSVGQAAAAAVTAEEEESNSAYNTAQECLQCHVRTAIVVDSCGCTSFCDECHLTWREFHEFNEDENERWRALSAPNFIRRMTDEELADRNIGNVTYPRCSRCSAWIRLEAL